MPKQDPIAVPSAEPLERVILGAMLLDSAAIQDASATLRADDMVLDSHKRIFRAILALVERSMGVDTNTVRAELERCGELSSVGGINYLLMLTDGIPRNMNVESYARIIKQKYLMRQAMSIHYEGSISAADPSQDPQQFLEESKRQIEELLADTSDRPMQTAGQFLQSLGGEDDLVESLASKDGLKIGWPQFDEITGGLQRGELIILAAHSGMGKTAAACNIVHQVAVVQGQIAGYFPFEDRRRAAIRRMLSASSGIGYRLVRDGKIGMFDRDTFREHHRLLSAAPLYMDDTNGLTMGRIRSRSQQLKRSAGGLDLLVIDQLSHIDDADVFKKGSSGEERLGWQALAAKRMAEDVDVPVILLHQLTQESAKRTNPRPVLSDLLGSGKIRNHADIVAFLYRAEYFDKNDELLHGKGEIIIAKNRQGITGDINMGWDGAIQRWTDPRNTQLPTDDRYGGQY